MYYYFFGGRNSTETYCGSARMEVAMPRAVHPKKNIKTKTNLRKKHRISNLVAQLSREDLRV